MTAQLYLQKAEMHLARGMEENALESLLAALACQDGEGVHLDQRRLPPAIAKAPAVRLSAGKAVPTGLRNHWRRN